MNRWRVVAEFKDTMARMSKAVPIAVVEMQFQVKSKTAHSAELLVRTQLKMSGFTRARVGRVRVRASVSNLRGVQP